MTKATTKPVAAASAKAVGAAVKPEVKPEAGVKPEATAQAPEAAKAAATNGVGDTDAIWVRAKKGVERRCRSGIVFTPVPVLLPVDELTQEQLDAIEADPLLELIDPPAEDAIVYGSGRAD